MVEYIIGGAFLFGVGSAIAYSIYEDSQFKKLGKECDKCCSLLQKLSQPENINKIVRMIKLNKENKYWSSLARSLEEI